MTEIIQAIDVENSFVRLDCPNGFIDAKNSYIAVIYKIQEYEEGEDRQEHEEEDITEYTDSDTDTEPYTDTDEDDEDIRKVKLKKIGTVKIHWNKI